MKPSEPKTILDVSGLKTYFYSSRGAARAVDGVSFHLRSGEVLGVVGESGSGKSVTALSIMQLIPDPPGKIVDGRVHFDGMNLLDLSRRQMRIALVSWVYTDSRGKNWHGDQLELK